MKIPPLVRGRSEEKGDIGRYEFIDFQKEVKKLR
jgi:hypothetical protein